MNGTLSESWTNLVQQFKARNPRERWMIIAAVACVFYGLFSIFVSPLLDQKKRFNDEIVNDNAKLEALTLELNNYTSPQSVDPDLPQKQQIAHLQKNLNDLEIKMDGLKNTLIAPEKMPDLLSDLLKNNSSLTLVSLKTLPTKGLFEQVEPSPPTLKNNSENNIDASLPIFKHGVEMTIEGRYLDLLDYVAGVEKLPWHVLWERANLTVDAQTATSMPLSQLTLTVYTLSLDKTWLSI